MKFPCYNKGTTREWPKEVYRKGNAKRLLKGFWIRQSRSSRDESILCGTVVGSVLKEQKAAEQAQTKNLKKQICRPYRKNATKFHPQTNVSRTGTIGKANTGGISIRCMGLASPKAWQDVWNTNAGNCKCGKRSPHQRLTAKRSAKGKEISGRESEVQPNKTKRRMRLKSVRDGLRAELFGINGPEWW